MGIAPQAVQNAEQRVGPEDRMVDDDRVGPNPEPIIGQVPRRHTVNGKMFLDMSR